MIRYRKFQFQIQKSFISIVAYHKHKDSGDWNPAGLIWPHHFTITYIHDDLIMGKTVLVRTKTVWLICPGLRDLGVLTDDKSILFQVTAWCPLTTSHCMSQCSPRSIFPHGITKPQWVNKYNALHFFLVESAMLFTLPLPGEPPLWGTIKNHRCCRICRFPLC